MKEIESAGKTREEAIANGLKQLGVDMHDVEKIDVIDEGSRGFLGLGARPVRVRLTVDSPDKPQRRDRGRPERRGGDGPRRPDRERPRQGGDQRQDKGPKTAEAGQDKDKRRKKKPRRRPEQEGQNNRRPEQHRGQQGDNRRRDNDRRPQKVANNHKATPIVGKAAANVTEEATEATHLARRFDNDVEEPYVENNTVTDELPPDARPDDEIEPITDEQGNEAAAMLSEMITLMNLSGTVTFKRCDDGSARLVIESGDDGGILIGKRGVTLGAIQYLINRMITRNDDAESTERLVVDVGDYVDRRKATLVDMAKSMARRAKETRRNVRLKPLSPQERRIVHLALEQDPQVRTYSLGDSLFRSIVISPAGARRNDNGPRRSRNQGGEGGARREQREFAPASSDE